MSMNDPAASPSFSGVIDTRKKLWSWLLIPALWLSVWWLAVLLFVLETRSGNSETAVSLGWIPTLLASAMTSLYLSNRTVQTAARVTREWDGATFLVGVLFVGSQVCLGSWWNGLVAGLVLITGEMQRVLLQQSLAAPTSYPTSPEARPAGQATTSLPSADIHSPNKATPTNSTFPPETLPHELAPPDSVPHDTGPHDRPPLATVPHETFSNEAVGSMPVSGQALVPPAALCADASRVAASEDLDALEMAGAADEEDEEDEEEVDHDEEASAPAGDWVQQMTRSRCVSPEPSDQAQELERVEWFYRYQWRPTEVQVDLHVVFQPAFLQKPKVLAEVVEGTGQVSIGEAVAHGARVQLKRVSAPSEEDFAVVWLEAIGPVQATGPSNQTNRSDGMADG